MCYADDDDCDMAQVVNNTKYELTLNPDEKCGRECNCSGWQVSLPLGFFGILAGNCWQVSFPLGFGGYIALMAKKHFQ